MSEQERIQRRYEARDASATLSGFWQIANPVVLHLAQERERAALALLTAHGVELAAVRLLDVGCGAGAEIPSYLRWGVPLRHIFGVDLMPARARAAHRHYGSRVAQASGAALPFGDAAFDLVVQNVVFSSIVEAAMRQRVAREMLRVLRPGGCVLWYDAVRTRGTDPHFCNLPVAEVESLFPGLRWRIRKLTTDLGVLRRVHAVFGVPGMALLDATGLFKTHVVALGHKA